MLSSCDVILLVLGVGLMLAGIFWVESKFARREDEAYKLIDQQDQAASVREQYERECG